MIKHPLADLCQRVTAKLPERPFAPAITMTIPLQPGQCPETLADDLRQWCAQNCKGGRWRPVGRFGPMGIEIAFECAIDATEFRLSLIAVPWRHPGDAATPRSRCLCHRFLVITEPRFAQHGFAPASSSSSSRPA
jgi:hypothetical protein